MAKNFIHLRCHTSYSLAQGAIKVEDLINLIKDNKMPALAVTDSGNLFCSLEFSLAAIKEGIQPIMGCILNLDIQNEHSKIVLLAKNEVGYKNLLKLVSKSFLVKYDNHPEHIKLEDLENYNAGIICLSGGHLGPVGQAILNNNKALAQQHCLKLKEIFADRFYIEIMRHGLIEEEKAEDDFLEFAYKHEIPLVATNDVMFATKNMFEAHHILNCISDGLYSDEVTSTKFTEHHYFKSSSEMEVLFKDLPEAITNTSIIAKRCAVMAKARDPMLPKVGDNETEELVKQARDGLEQRLANYTGDKSIYFDRLEFELDVIIKMGFPGYFLIVSDFIKWSKNNGIPVGPGRGSGAGRKREDTVSESGGRGAIRVWGWSIDEFVDR